MKKLSFALLVGLSILAISAFTFCSSAGAKDTLDSSAENLPAVQKEAVQKESEKAATTKPAPASIDPVSKEEDGMTWYLDLNSAVDKSKAEGKPILGFFTGSDWCGWCIKLQNNVLKKEEFKTWAEDNVVLMELDFPRRTKQDAELTAQNKNLASLFKVTGYPTVWYFNGEKNKETGKLNLTPIGKTGYPRAPGQEVQAFIKASEGIINPVVKEETEIKKGEVKKEEKHSK